jgi:hypothetical protein
VQPYFRNAALSVVDAVRFDKFLELPSPLAPSCDALLEVAPAPRGGITASLLTRHVAAQSGMARLKVHARAGFGFPAAAPPARPPAPGRPACPADAFQVPAERLYAEMVPFGTAFQNVVSTVQLWPQGALAVVSGGPAAAATEASWGSFFPLDAGLHAACAWCQRYEGIVAFPVAMSRRWVLQPTRAGEQYDAAVAFAGRHADGLHFELQLRDRKGRLREAVEGLVMRDVSRGRLQPPDWVRAR